MFLANPFVLNSISIIANVWFPEKERGQATAIAGLMAPLGNLIGYIIAGTLAAGVDSEDPIDCMQRLRKLVFVQNAIFSVFAVALIFLIKDKPLIPPSRLAQTFHQIVRPSLKNDLVTLSKNKNVLLTATAFMLLWGNFVALGNVLTPLFKD